MFFVSACCLGKLIAFVFLKVELQKIAAKRRRATLLWVRGRDHLQKMRPGGNPEACGARC